MIRNLLLCLFIASSTHDIHFSKSFIYYNPDSRALHTVINVFTDDLEHAIEIQHEELDLEIGSDNQHILTDSLVSDYILNNFKFTNNHLNIPINFIGLEYDYDIIYLYLESDTFDINAPNTLEVSLFFEIFDDQENVVDYEAGILKQGLMFTSRDRKIELNIFK
jgi:hypothetical protein|tara:strand:- start:58 stop:549 length:492 start_codon:yes stop_codon:yes gene_type:complete